MFIREGWSAFSHHLIIEPENTYLRISKNIYSVHYIIYYIKFIVQDVQMEAGIWKKEN